MKRSESKIFDLQSVRRGVKWGGMNIDLLRRVCAAPGAPGFEFAVRELIIKEITPLVDSISIDNIGNVIALKKGKDSSKSMMAAAHMDEIGFIVRHIDDKGFLRILPLGGFDPKTLVAQRVIVHGKKDLLGCMGCKPIHVMTVAERAKMPEVTDFYVDLGMTKAEVEKVVTIGDAITRERDLVQMGSCVNVKSLDNRGGCYILIETLRTMADRNLTPAYDFVAAFTVQEEVGLRGAQVGTMTVAPDFAVALDVTIAYDTPGGTPHEMCTEMGKGAAIKVYDTSLVADRRMVEYMKSVGDAYSVAWQPELLSGGGTDAGAMQRFVGGGSIAGAISVPTRNIHQSVEMASCQDFDACVELLTGVAVHLADWNWAWGGRNESIKLKKPVQAAKEVKKSVKKSSKSSKKS